MIKDKIASAQRELLRLKETYKNLVKNIKETFYDKEDYWVKDSPRKPKNEAQKFKAALCLAEGNCPRNSFEIQY